jgi:NADH-ubiquinone oxidoreductase chain 5
MEGPTPVSALIHAATMVTAGVFLIARCSFLFELSPFVLNVIIFIGAITAFFASTTGLFQNDIKKVIAYSTCSQLGYMIFACGLSSYNVGIFHLFNHAFFKALLFLGAGSIIHAMSNEQDMRKMGGLKNLLPFSYSVILIGSLALTGFPFLSGFYSKDTILELSFAAHTNMSFFSYILGVLGAFCTSFYSMRLLFLVFLSKPNGSKVIIKNSHEGSLNLGLPLFILIFFSVFIGFLTKDLFIGFGTNFWGPSIYILSNTFSLSDIEFIPLFFKILPLLVTIFGALLAFFLYSFKIQTIFSYKMNSSLKSLYTFFNKKWYFDRLYNSLISQAVFFSGYVISYKEIDRGLLEKFGPYGSIFLILKGFETIKGVQSGNIFHYLFLFFLFIILICFIFLFF